MDTPAEAVSSLVSVSPPLSFLLFSLAFHANRLPKARTSNHLAQAAAAVSFIWASSTGASSEESSPAAPFFDFFFFFTASANACLPKPYSADSARSRRLLAPSFLRSSDCTKILCPASINRSRNFRLRQTSEISPKPL